jgi:hypothetical protein
VTKDDILASVGDDEVETLQWHAVRTALGARNIEVDDAMLNSRWQPLWLTSPHRYSGVVENAHDRRPNDSFEST